MRINEAVILITGGAEGIGAACARECLARSAKVVIADIRTPDHELLRDADLFVQGDVTREDVRAEVVARTIERFGKLDVVINNAGVGLYSFAHSAPAEPARRVFEVNVFAALGVAQLAAPHLAKSKGVLVNIGSIGGDVALPWASLYCASKFALHAVSECLRRELRPQGVRVITVKPGVVETGFRHHVLSGQPPKSVEGISAMSSSSLAKAICRKIEGRGSTLYKPWYGRAFSWVDRVAPWIADLYVSRFMGKVTLQRLPLRYKVAAAASEQSCGRNVAESARSGD